MDKHSYVSSVTYIGLASEADCLLSYLNISGTAEFRSESETHSLMNSTQKKVFQLVVSWLLHVLYWRLMSCHLSLPWTSSEHSLLISGLQPINVKLCISLHPETKPSDPPQTGSVTLLPVEESTKFLGLWWDSRLSFKKHISALKTQCKAALNLIRVVAHLKWGGYIDTLLMLYRTIVRSKLDYGCIVYGTASHTNLRQLDSIHSAGLRLALRAFCTSPVSSRYTDANDPLWRNVDWSCPWITIWKLVPTLTTQHILP